ncbi:chemotaxis-specific protein-glutamate methyltransferase CheB [Erythrobacter sp. SCSIO 43205]|uniref:chemotaxis-specific protein-glutamate methyltransferase CheB n=1 Tax=Erythrobacter sp. SCSIO 43205 TaxID=2779361 RepID=UPI001CA91C28|nr:chemotaxis-specific protein-glutamate methyltransferase CheB [Erythrobacter sp. SCSIO 43205]UAB77967.1 chemotaxis-specific protein-glutamate methyltransferase CheB [Erythrobacter sp. SCSIO 43205]
MNAPASLGPRASVRRLVSSRRSEPRIRVMIVDDSLTVRTIFKRMVDHDPRMEVVATASSGERAITALEKAAADVVLLDLEMPGMGGIKALPQILKASPDTQVLVVSSLTAQGAETTVEALSQGAADTLLKPCPGEFTERYRSQLLGKITALGTKNKSSSAAKDMTPCASGQTASRKSEEGHSFSAKSHRAQAMATNVSHTRVIAIGASTGGIHALNILLKTLTPACTAPILITQHLPASFIPVFARQIENASGRPTHIAQSEAVLREGEIMLATGDSHLCLTRQKCRLIACPSTEPALSGCLPSVDPMFTSLVDACDGQALGILLSGMGRDGLEGARALVKAGGEVWAQDAETSAVWGMPGAVAKNGLASLVDTPHALGLAIVEKLARQRGAAR